MWRTDDFVTCDSISEYSLVLLERKSKGPLLSSPNPVCILFADKHIKSLLSTFSTRFQYWSARSSVSFPSHSERFSEENFLTPIIWSIALPKEQWESGSHVETLGYCGVFWWRKLRQRWCKTSSSRTILISRPPAYTSRQRITRDQGWNWQVSSKPQCDITEQERPSEAKTSIISESMYML